MIVNPHLVHARAERRVVDDCIAVMLYVINGDGSRSIASPLTFTNHQPGNYVEPTMRLQEEEAQRLMDELWSVGLRPAGGKGSAGQLAATERHLEDMRRVAGLST